MAKVSGSFARGPLQTLFNCGSVVGMSDGQLLERFLSQRDGGAESAAEALVALHGPMVWGVCRAILSDPHAAEDAFQATFLVLARKASSIRRPEAVGAWLHGVARRIAVRARASARRREGQERRVAMRSTAAQDPDPGRREQFEALHEEVGRLPEKYRAPVVLCHLEGRTHAEAAGLLGCPVGTVSVRLARARERLRARLARRGLALSGVLAGAAVGAQPASAATIRATVEAANRVAFGKAMAAGTVPAAVSRLMHGELVMMKLAGLKTVVGMGLVAAVAGLGAACGLSVRAAPGAAAPPAARADDAGAKAESVEKLKRIGLAMHEYRVANEGRFFPYAIHKGGKPLLSWRVALLPLLGQQALYDKFHLDEAWDSPHNKALLKEMPDVYAPVARKGGPEHATYYQGFVGPGAIFDGEKGTAGGRLTDGAFRVLVIAEAARPVPWTKPEDLAFDEDASKPAPRVGGLFEGGFHALVADGSVVFLSKAKVDPMTLRGLITIDGGEAANPADLKP